MTDQTKPLPCPFCKQAYEEMATILFSEPYNMIMLVSGWPEAYVICVRCKSRGPAHIKTFRYDSGEEAIKLWNQR